MPFEPEFMRKLEQFKAERGRVRTLEDWRAFHKRWFDTSLWPRKGQSEVAVESLAKKGPIVLQGRKWGRSTAVYDLTPEACYEYS